METKNRLIDWINSPLYLRVVGILVVILALGIIFLFSNVGWMTVIPSQLVIVQTNPNTGEMQILAELDGIVKSDRPVELTAAELFSGSNEALPSLDIDKALAGEDAAPRLVDRFLIVIPLLALIIALIGGAYAVGLLSSDRLFTLLIASAVLFILAPIWKILSIIDFQGYDAVPQPNPRSRRVLEPLLNNFSDFHNFDEHQFFAGVLLLVVFVAWLLKYLYGKGMLEVSYFGDLRDNFQTYFKKRSIMDYVTAIVLLGATIIILDWFVPQVVGNQEKFIQLTYNGFSQGILLALIALGLVLIYKATDVINFAHGEIMMLGAYIFAELIIRYKASLAVAIVVAALLLIVFGALIERLVLRPLIGEPIISVIMVTIGLSSIIEALVRLQWRSRIIDWQEADSGLPEGVLPLFREIFPKDSGIYRELSSGTYPLYSPETTIPFPLRYENVYLTIIAAIFIAILILFFKYSKHGIAMRATADDQQAALSMGISVKRIFAIAWGIAALFAGIAGVLSGDTGTGANTGIPAIGLRAFPVIILGGLDSIVGAVIGGIVIGLLQSYSSGYLDPWLGENAEFLVLQVPTEQVLPYIVLIVVLMFRPYGLFGQQRIERV